jgi:hypothetical protein
MKYEAPEIFELGDAEELTLAGLCGLVLDADGFPRFKCRPGASAGETEPAGE